MMTSSRRQYLLVENRRRRYSAPETVRSFTSEDSEPDSSRSKVSSIDFSVLFEGHSGSDSSLELDTTISREASPIPERKQPAGCYDCRITHQTRINIWCLICTWPVWRSVLTAQAMAICVSVFDLAINNMNDKNSSLSVSVKIFPLYVSLGMFWTPQLAVRGGGRGLITVLRHSGLRYMFLALFHVEGSTMTISTLQLKSYIGNQTIDCVAAWLSFVIAYVCLEVEFQKTHVAGFGVAFIGAIGMWLTNPEEIGDSDEAWGDIMRFGLGLFLSFNTLAQELIVKSIDSVEYLGMIGLLGSFICAIQAVASNQSGSIPENVFFWCSFLLYSITQFIFSCLKPKVLREIGTTGMHLALISSPFYSQILLYFINNSMNFFAVPFLLIIIGSYLFTLKRTTIGKHYFYPVQVTLEN